MNELALFLFAAHGATQIATRGRIFNSIRPNHYYFHCAMCMGFAVGFLFGICFQVAGLMQCQPTWQGMLALAFFLGCANSGVTYGLNAIVDDGGLRLNQ